MVIGVNVTQDYDWPVTIRNAKMLMSVLTASHVNNTVKTPLVCNVHCERLKGLTINHLHTQLDPFVSDELLLE